ncbi:MAG: ATP-binding cassette domain-containing protein [Actinobacteria bacterium]|uniref:Unannotated protein n=1 Tax=freshwater metagenome TaxID=449393 RepID=A0A6J6P2C8_9ZZZZ|nr:ATP-binding cassette domain-containing protein [Actinomycetota bacterium]
MSVLEVRGLQVRRGRRQVVHDVDLTLARGEVVAVLGPNGAGKSTLVEAVGGLLPSQGAVRIEGRAATVLQTPGLARRTARANVELALAWWGVPRRERRARAMAALDLMRAAHLAGRQAGSLSGGEARRVHLARGVAVAPDLLLLDEPFAGLDPESHAALSEDATSALRATGGGVLVVLHDRADAWAMADRVAVLVDGRLVADAAPDRLLAAPPTAEVARFLGYDGCLVDASGSTLTRAPHVRLVPAGEPGLLEGAVARVVRLQDGARVEVATAAGTVWALVDATDPGGLPRVGARVGVRVSGGVRFPPSV